MNVALITGSHRENSNSIKVAKFFEKYLQKMMHSCTFIELNKYNIPFWDEGVWKYGENWNSEWKVVSNILREMDAFVFFIPEYGGMAPPKLKNLFLLSSEKDIGHKPALMVGVSTGIGGSYPLSELRMSGFKNNKVNFIPEQIIVRNVGDLFENNVDEGCREERLHTRIHKTLEILMIYSKAFKQIRSEQAVKEFPYPYGM